MTAVTLNPADATELARLLQFLADWLNRDPGRLRASLEDFAGHPACNTSQLREGPGTVHIPARRQRRGISFRLTAVTAAGKLGFPAGRGYARAAIRASLRKPDLSQHRDSRLQGWAA